MDKDHETTASAGRAVASMQAPGAVAAESRALFWAAVGLVLGALVAVIVFRDVPAPLWGRLSIGTVSALVSAALGLVVFGISYARATRRQELAWRRRLPKLIRAVDALGLAVLHVSIIFIGCLLAFDVLQNAFKGLALEGFAAGLVTGTTVAVSVYFVYLGGANVTSYTLSTLLAVFLVAGGLTSMSTAENPLWWETNFSALGVGGAVSAFAFNTTMMIAGVVITSLAGYTTADLRQWAKGRSDYRAGGIAAIKWLLVAVGILLIGVAVFPVDTMFVLHNVCATGMMVVFAGLIASIRWTVPGFSSAFFTLSDVILGALVVTGLLFFPVGYLGLTAVELVAAALVFVWLIVFVRNIGAAFEDNAQSEGSLTWAQR